MQVIKPTLRMWQMVKVLERLINQNFSQLYQNNTVSVKQQLVMKTSGIIWYYRYFYIHPVNHWH